MSVGPSALGTSVAVEHSAATQRGVMLNARAFETMIGGGNGEEKGDESKGMPKLDAACALGRPGVKCLLDAEIQTLVDIYNSKIGSKKPVPDTLDRQKVLDVLESKTGCVTEECAVYKILEAVRGTMYEPVVLRIRDMAFKVDGPGELTALLDSFLIIRLCRQIEGNYKGVKFGGVLTIDFMNSPPISEYGDPMGVWRDYRENKWRQLQFIFNIDHRMGTGQHWTALVVDMDAKQVQYFDSYGQTPPDGILVGSRVYKGITDEQGRFLSMLNTWINDVRAVFISHGIALGFDYNTKCHQAPRDQSNCGPYAIVFLALRAKGVALDAVKKNLITTAEITAVRDRLYRRTSNYHPVPPE